MEMSETVEKEKSKDKKEIEDEEKERMLNEENKERGGGGGEGEEEGGDKKAAEDADGEKKGGEGEGEKEEQGSGGEKEKPKGRSGVIGAIKVPTFLTRGRSRDGGKDGNPDTEEGKDLLESSSNPGSQAGASGSQGGQKSRLAVFEKIRLPKPFSKMSKDKTQESGGKGEEVIDNGDNAAKEEGDKEGTPLNAEGDKDGAEPDDGMETVKLESDVEKQDGDKESRKSLKEGWGKYEWRNQVISTLSQNQIIIGGLLLFILLLIVIIAIAASSGGGGKSDSLEGASADFLHVEGRLVSAITSCGPIQGWVEDGAFAFRGIPYALPPEGKLRWKLPVPLQRLEHCWNGTLVTRNATVPPPELCWQNFRNGSLDGSEDCLTVDVFAPRLKRNSPRLPVVVLVAAETLGGGGGKGYISPQLLSPKLARAAGVIFIRVRFRLGIFGFLSARALTRSVHPPRSGNYGLADVRAALEWTNLNVMSFGGDPSSITVLGHRAGATLVLALAASRKAPRLFSRAWLSGPAGGFPPGGEASLLKAEKQGDTFVQSLPCDGDGGRGGDEELETLARCMRRQEGEDLVDAFPHEWKWRPVDLPRKEEDPASLHHWLIVDGEVLNESPLDAWERHGLLVPLVIGTTTHGEATAELRRRMDWSESRTVMKHVLESAVGEKAEDALQLYSSPSFPPSTTNTFSSPPPLARLTAMITDIRSICPLINFTRSAAKFAKNVPVYFYTVASLPEEAGSIGAVPEAQDEPDVASAVVGPGADMAAILSHPLREVEGSQPSAIARMFYTYVRHGPTGNTTSKKNIAKEGDEMEEVGSWPEAKMPSRLLFLGPDGKVESVENYPRCDFWTKAGFVPRYARLD